LLYFWFDLSRFGFTLSSSTFTESSKIWYSVHFCFAILLGPGTFGSHMFSKARFPLTLVYFSSLFATLFCSIWWRSTLLTLICVIVQVFTFIWFMLAYIPGGERGMRYLTSTVTRLMRSRIIPFSSSSSSSSTLPV
ncbi:Protein transport protein SFT2, partial [Trichinella papuae]